MTIHPNMTDKEFIRVINEKFQSHDIYDQDVISRRLECWRIDACDENPTINRLEAEVDELEDRIRKKDEEIVELRCKIVELGGNP